MDYVVVFIGGWLLGYAIAYSMTRITAIKQLRKELNLPETLQATTNPYAVGDKERDKYKPGPASMWGPMPKDQGNGSL